MARCDCGGIIESITVATISIYPGYKQSSIGKTTFEYELTTYIIIHNVIM